jgi:HEPN domain-containing protein
MLILYQIKEKTLKKHLLNLKKKPKKTHSILAMPIKIHNLKIFLIKMHLLFKNKFI